MSRKGKKEQDGKIIKDSLFPVSLFVIYRGVVCLMSGVHQGLLVLMHKLGWGELVQTLVPMFYWGLVAVGLTLFTRKKIKETYEVPLHRLAKATEEVAGGDFSVYVPTVHAANRLDYLDVMILDFNKMVEELGSVETLKTDFISNVSHEMKTPIAIIKNYAQLIQMENTTDAIKFTDPGGSVQVRQKFRDSFIEVEVTDTGCGMNRESVKHIFDKFYQGDTSHSKEGNGLGLALVKRVLVLMDGEISVKSEEGKGSTFKVILPKAEQTREQAEVERNNE